MNNFFEIDNNMEPAFTVKGQRPLSYDAVDKLLVDADDSLAVSYDGLMWRTATLTVNEVREQRLVDKLESVGNKQARACAEWFMERLVELEPPELIEVIYVNSALTKWGAFHS